MAQLIGKGVLKEFNRDKGIPEATVEDEKFSNLVVGSIMDAQAENPIGIFASFLGDFATLGTEGKITLTFVDVVPDRGGSGDYCGILYHNFETVEETFWRRIFKGKANWPPNVKFYAISSNAFSRDFPGTKTFARFSTFPQRLLPPRKMLSEVVLIGGEKQLLAAMACRNPSHYFLIAVCPYEAVKDSVKQVRDRLLFAGISFVFLILVLSWRLQHGILNPTSTLIKGIQAMEKKNLSHRIRLEMGDEWDALGEAFNKALVSMQELEVASLVQKQIFPQGTVKSGPFSFQGKCIMTSRVGGDFFDALPLPNRGLAFIFGDVSGHSVSAALVVAMVKAAFGCLIKAGVSNPSDLFSRLNQLLCSQLGKAKMMPCLSGFGQSDGTLHFLDAGHLYPYLIFPDGRVEAIKQAGFPLGTFPKGIPPAESFGPSVSGVPKTGLRAAYRHIEIKLSTPSRLVIFTDGIIEALNPQEEPFGYERLEACIKNSIFLDSHELVIAVLAELELFTRTKSWKDDVSIAVFEYDPGKDKTNP